MARLLIGYDIHLSSRRRQTLKTLRALTACYQNSFFDCELLRIEVSALFTELTEHLDPSEDGLIFAWDAMQRCWHAIWMKRHRRST